MRRTRPVLPLFLATAALLALSLGGPAAVASDLAANRGWCSPLGTLEDLVGR
jgi:hypothetical protein